MADASIATVDSNGTLTAHKSGTTTIQAKAGEVLSNQLSIEVKVPIALQSISISPNPVNLRIGHSVQVNVTGHYSDGSAQSLDNATYTIDDPSIASVDGSGTIDAIAEGTTILQVKAGLLTASADVVLAKELNTTNFSFTDFGSAYIDKIPMDATKEHYDEKRFCMIAGQIRSEEGAPLQGVRVSIHKHPEYGTNR